MPGPSSDLARLRTRWAMIAEQPASTLTADQRRSVEYFLADTGQEPHPSREVAKWAALVHELDAFVAAAGRMPAADHRRPRPRTPEQRLVDQVAYQRRLATHGLLTEYQRDRLETIPGFLWHPQDQRWLAMFEKHQQFWRRHHREPRRRSPDPAEAAIERWVAHQRALAGAGRLLPERERLLRAAAFRILR